MKLKEHTDLNRSISNSSSGSTRQILPINFIRSSSPPPRKPADQYSNINDNNKKYFSHSAAVTVLPYKTSSSSWITSIIQSIIGFVSLIPINIINVPAACRWRLMSLPSKLLQLGPPDTLGRKVTGTLFGSKKGHVSFTVQEDPRSEPVVVLELGTSTCTLVKEMSSGLVRIALECERGSGEGAGSVKKLYEEPRWSMYCNGKRCGYAVGRECGEVDWHVLSMLQTVTVGAGVIPIVNGGGGGGGGSGKRVEGAVEQVMYMRAMFERVVGGRDSEAYYMMNPDRTGAVELSIFLLRI